jgi:hypothetical protein
MGTMIHLSLGHFQIDWGKNNSFYNHCALFQKADLGIVPDYGYEEPVMMEGCSRSLRDTVSRLELLGYTLEGVKREYNLVQNELGGLPLTFKNLCSLIKTVNVGEITGKWSDSSESKFIPKKIIDKVRYCEYRYAKHRPDYWDLDAILDDLSPYAKLRLLAENSSNLALHILWPFGELVENGWAKREEFLPNLSPQAKFLIVTEGSSDSKILQKAFSLLKPEYADFFRFIDMEEGYPFSGTGNLYKFCQGLVSIGILNQVVVLYDNDAEGVSKYDATKRLSLPSNMIAAKLPDIPALRKMNTVGPNGESREDINGRAASIECYLDLNFKRTQSKPRIRWSSYIDTVDRYQGALENKTSYMKSFLNLKRKDPIYDYSKIEAVLNHLYNICIEMTAAQNS